MNFPYVTETLPVAERLEPRRLLAATIVNNVLVGTGTSGNDVISVRRVLTDDVVLTINGVAKTFDMDDFTGVRLEGLSGNDTFRMIDALVLPVVRNATILGGAGNDSADYSARSAVINFFIDPTGPSELGLPGASSGAQTDEFAEVETVIGGAGNDRFTLAQARDADETQPVSYRLEGRGGNDVFDDKIWPSSDAYGFVTMRGGAGDDSFLDESDQRFTRELFFGEAGNDSVQKERFAGSFDGGSGIDTLHFQGGGGGDLRKFPGFENATATHSSGGPTDEPLHLTGTDGPNHLSISGRGTIQGLGGDDTLVGSNEDDALDGGAGNDWLAGRDGNDTLNGAAGIDTLDGGAGSNVNLNGEVLVGLQVAIGIVNRLLNVIGTGAGQAISLERTGTDNVIARVGGVAREFDMDDFDGVSVLGLGGNDVITIRDALVAGTLVRKVTIDGGGGNDSITGSSADDVIRGSTGNDTLFGLAGRDALFGGAGNDRLIGGLGQDFLDGGDNDDFIDAREGAPGDTVQGGNGSDTAEVDPGDTTTNVETFA